ncbi:hypothetical protein GA549_08115 [Bifidobacterium adolescentis]|uniref:Uncharacterized protein n=1 Tax=Bifidobacterium adolescentis TaxID=1680 RepID=A0A6I0V9W7_BIFAD|nr:hypothetical protein GA599_07335 [Bifidobacterium adolescentis]KAB5970503.1 hypothetical protein GA578_07310 [Bifidobacterium adolescentis]KAB5972741.1 hypothetical protein GA577_08065 [Bifidobacterium adolescentis]KAB5974116.1 hypothetical protein GA576_08540 [Bifidobacterium adolescentis]KAB5975600.1 hypothetical protein GA569_08110 [Bifidobacterium adolescentis]
MAVTPAIWCMPIFSEDEEESEFDLSDFALELPPHAVTPRHMTVAQTAVTALERSDLRMGPTIAAKHDFHVFFQACANGHCRMEKL